MQREAKKNAHTPFEYPKQWWRLFEILTDLWYEKGLQGKDFRFYCSPDHYFFFKGIWDIRYQVNENSYLKIDDSTGEVEEFESAEKCASDIMSI